MIPRAYQEMASNEDRNWAFVGRRRILESLIVGLGLNREAKILEIGAGTGGNLAMLSRFGHVSAVEMDGTARAMAIEKCKGTVDVLPGSCPDNIPFQDQVFDLICLIEVLEHIDSDVETLRALKARLAPGGVLLMTVPAHQWLWTKQDDLLEHKRRYSRSELRSKAAEAGFPCVRVSFFNALLFPVTVLAWLLGKAAPARKSIVKTPCEQVNRVLLAVMAAERHWVRMIDMPIGTHLFGLLSVSDGSNDSSRHGKIDVA